MVYLYSLDTYIYIYNLYHGYTMLVNGLFKKFQEQTSIKNDQAFLVEDQGIQRIMLVENILKETGDDFRVC